MIDFSSLPVIHVHYAHPEKSIPVGRLAFVQRRIFFEYNPSFLELGLALSPFKLPLRSGSFVCEDRAFDGLFGVFNDSLPDGWGRLLLDRALIKKGLNPGALTALDRLRYVGCLGMGALCYEPEIKKNTPPLLEKDLDVLAYECLQFQEHEEDLFVEELLRLNGSSAGASPKILVNIEDDSWLIKFRSVIDPKDIGSIEYAYHLMAIKAGLLIPNARLFPSKNSSGHFGVQRFDRRKSQKVHMHTLSGLLHIDHRIPNTDYEILMKVTLWLTKDARECKKQFRNVVFNVLAHNRDDHAKNFSFLMDHNGTWTVSPSYDLVFSSGPGGEHHCTVMGEGKAPQKTHLLKLASLTGLKNQEALQIIEEVKYAISLWSHFAKEAGVSKASSQLIQKSLNLISKQF